MIKNTQMWLRVVPVAGAALALLAAPLAHAQVQTIDPNSAIDADINHGQPAQPAQPARPATPSMPAMQPGAPQTPPQGSDDPMAPATDPAMAPAAGVGYAPSGGQVGGPVAQGSDDTYHENELVNAAENVFGKGARGLALMIRDVLKKQGEPDGYITGSEGGGAFVVGFRYGSGVLHHKIEGQMPVYWTGPSIGFDVGGSGGSTFVLIYNLHDTEKLFGRIGAGEGQAYLLGGFNVSYLRKDDLVVIPVRMGAGLRLGVNGGYLNFTHKQKWVPF
jgi:hypothetical protein